eukprot:TRINITY_DN49364_c0_g1_i1.p1 TRINITY_DN49364_c0_g1~~TRINITY_DN49364_c0_g1_i1.p1  ORF type:complete len:763 (+),score=426.35 TRINITY_DN49364_c0_g1_i1:37-2325(+)
MSKKNVAVELAASGAPEVVVEDRPHNTRFKAAVRKVTMGLNVVAQMRRSTFKHADADGRLPLSKKLVYAAPSFSLLSLTMLIGIHGIVFYESIGASLTFIAFFTALARSFDVITDPLMGWVSDSTRTRFGRRRPYIFFGNFGYAFMFFALMSPPESLSKNGTAYWFGAFYTVFYFFDTIANVPYTAWGPELTDLPAERESVFFWRGLFDKVGVLAGAAGPAIVGQFLDKDPVTGKADDREVYRLLATIFGSYYIITMCNLVFRMKERGKSMETRPVPLVPSVLRAFKNVAFRPLLIGWVLDYMALGMISSMLPFFVKHVLVPNDPGQPGFKREAVPDDVLGVGLGLLFVSAALAQPVWKWLSGHYGKRNVWLAYNLFNSLSCFGFVLLGEGDLAFFYVLSILNGIPIGGQFLIEAILSDVIDYDEFLNGTRSEGSFTVFAQFIPKVVSIPASAIPLAVISAVGFSPSIDQVDQHQTTRVRNTIRIIFSLIPSFLTLAAYFVKLQFPIKTEEQVADVSRGIILHEAGKAAYDPVVGVDNVNILKLSESDQNTAWLLDNFAWSTLIKFSEGASQHLARVIYFYLFLGVTFLAAFVAVIFLMFPLIDDDAWAWAPAFSAIMAGMMLCWIAVSVLRLQAARALEGMEVPKDLVERIIQHKRRGQRGGDAAYELLADENDNDMSLTRARNLLDGGENEEHQNHHDAAVNDKHKEEEEEVEHEEQKQQEDAGKKQKKQSKKQAKTKKKKKAKKKEESGDEDDSKSSSD